MKSLFLLNTFLEGEGVKSDGHCEKRLKAEKTRKKEISIVGG